MKINIGAYRDDLIPASRYQRKYEMLRAADGYYLERKDYTWYDRAIFGLLDKLDDLARPINKWSNMRKRRVDVRIDNYDVWAADHTLALIIAPTLKKLKEVKHGHPHVDNEDVPEDLRFTLSDKEKIEWDGTVDSKHEARWEWVIDEMIWAFEQHAMEDDSDQFHHNTDQLQMVFAPIEGKKTSAVSFNHQKDPTKPAYWIDHEGKKKHAERKQNGLRLFAKYYECLWD